MKAFERIIRKIYVELAYFLSVSFAILALLSLVSFISSLFVSDASALRWLSLGMGAAYGLVAWLFFRSAQKYKAHATWSDKLRQRSEQNTKALLHKKACPQCGKRLDVCDRTPQLRINPVAVFADREFYCPACDERFNVNETYADYIPREREIPQSSGEEFRVKPGTPVLTLAIILVFALLGVLFLLGAARSALAFTSIEIPTSAKITTLLMMSVFALVFLGGAFLMFRSWKQVLGVFFRLLDDGLVSYDGITTRYFMWEDFRIAQYLPKAYMGKPGYAFDTKEHQFIILSNIKDYQRLCGAILEKLRDTNCRILT